jgi:ornithine cyclodeaminase
MTVRVLDEAEVRRLLPMHECIELMTDALAALARGELYNPLRFVVRPPDEPSLLGLMPAHRSGPNAVYALKTVAIFPGNSARGLDSHQGFVALFDGVTGETRTLMNAGAITAVRTAPASRRVRTSRRCGQSASSSTWRSGAERRDALPSSTAWRRRRAPRRRCGTPT